MPQLESLAPNQKGSGWRTFIEVPLVISGALIIFALMGLSVSDALLRSFFNKPIFGANDYAQIFLSFAVAVSFPLCVLAGRLIAIDTIVLMLPKKIQMLLDWAVTTIGVMMLGYLAWRAYLNAVEAAMFAEATLLLQLPYGPSYYAVAFGCAMSAILLAAERIFR